MALNNVQLGYLAKDDPELKPSFYGTIACNRLPKNPLKSRPQGYIVNTDPHDKPGEQWLVVWTHGNICEVIDSYGLLLEPLQASRPVERMDPDPLEVCDSQWKSLPSLQ